MQLFQFYIRGVKFQFQSLPLPFKIQPLSYTLRTDEPYNHLWIYAEPLQTDWARKLLRGNKVVFRGIKPEADPLGYTEEDIVRCEISLEKKSEGDFAYTLEIEVKSG